MRDTDVQREIDRMSRKQDDDDIQDYVRPWRGLTDAERNKLWRDVIKWGDPSHDEADLMKAVEAKLKEKNR
jgi:hypothetical protein